MKRARRSGSFEFVYKFDEAGGLLLQAVAQFGVFEFGFVIKQVIDLWQEHAFRIEVSVAVAENHLQHFDGPQCAPHPRAETHEAHWTALEALREFEHVDEIL